MRTWTKNLVALAAVAMMGSWSATPAGAVEKTAESAGSIKGTVMKDGQPAGGVAVRLIKAADAPARRQLAAGEKPPAGEKPEGVKPGKPGKPPKGERPERPVPVKETTTDGTTGAFVLDGIPAGEYIVQAGDRATGSVGRSKVTVTAGGAATVTVELKERKAPKA